MNETTNKQNIIIYCQSAYVSHDRAITGAMADPTIAEKGKLPQESYISYKRVGHFCHIFYMVSIYAYLFFNTSIATVGTHERIAKIRV